jgi:hypothetical protein
MGPKILLDTTVLKFSAAGSLSYIPVNRKTRNWYGRVTGFQFYEIGYVDRNKKIRNRELKREVGLLRKIAELAKKENLQLLMQDETIFESWGLPAMGSPTGPFYGAPITRAESPIKHGYRTLFAPSFGVSPDDLTKNFLAGIRDKRFERLAKITGGYQGKGRYNLNQMRDAFYIWCAEYNNCDFLLTLDFKLIRMVRRNTRHDLQVTIVKPSELLYRTGNMTRLRELITRAMIVLQDLFTGNG